MKDFSLLKAMRTSNFKTLKVSIFLMESKIWMKIKKLKFRINPLVCWRFKGLLKKREKIKRVIRKVISLLRKILLVFQIRNQLRISTYKWTRL
jgi:hypothetical protein